MSNISYILNKVDLATLNSQGAKYEIGKKKGSYIAHVGIAIDSRATAVDIY
jgi:hypothetical protein